MAVSKSKTVRIPSDLYDRIKSVADSKQSTVPKQIVYFVEQELRRVK